VEVQPDPTLQGVPASAGTLVEQFLSPELAPSGEPEEPPQATLDEESADYEANEEEGPASVEPVAQDSPASAGEPGAEEPAESIAGADVVMAGAETFEGAVDDVPMTDPVEEMTTRVIRQTAVVR
jgi:hypothetical protein